MHDFHQLFHASPFSGYVYPNETVVPWSILIVIYPYMTGLVAGAFTASSLYHVFGMERFKPVARFALLIALCFLVFVPVTLLMHLGHPERAFNAMITPHTTSAMAIFGYVASFYLILLALEIWFVFREDIVHGALHATGWRRALYRVLSLGSLEISEQTRAYDHKWLLSIAIIGIPAAHGLHGYVGFIFGSLKSREWWSSDLMPVIFLFSAVISGVAVLIVMYWAVSRMRKVDVDMDCIKGLMATLWGFLIFTFVLEVLEYTALSYRMREGTETIIEYTTEGPMFWRFFVVQLGLGAFVPLVIMSVLMVRNTTGKALLRWTLFSATLVLVSVLFMRYNVVIGGQEISKSMKGIIHYVPPWGGREGLWVAIALLLGPLGLLWLLTRVFNPWQSQPAH